MNATLQALLTQLNSSQSVSLPAFISALELEPNIVLSNIFTGTVINSNTIDFKNCSEGSESLQNISLFKPDNTVSWLFNFSGYNLTGTALYLKVDSTDDEGSVISMIITGNLIYSTFTIPVLITKNSERIIMNLYIDEDTSINYEFTMLETFLGSPSMKTAYPDAFQSAAGLDCLSICWTYSIPSESMSSISIISSAPDWSAGDLFKFELTNCTITANILLPYDINNISFKIKGVTTICEENSTEVEFVLPSYYNTYKHLIMTDGNIPVTSLVNIIHLFQNTYLPSLLPVNLGLLSNLIVKSFVYVYDQDESNIITYSVDLSLADSNAVWEIIPGVVSLKQPELRFSYSPLYCDVSGILSLNNCDLGFKTAFRIDPYDPETSLFFQLKEIQQSVPVDLSDLSPFGVSVSDIIPFPDLFNFNLHNLELGMDITPSIQLTELSTALSTANDWQIFPGFALGKTYFNLNFSRDDTFDFKNGYISSEIQAGDLTIPVELTIPETGDWTLSFIEGNDSSDDTDYEEGYPAIPIPGIGDITSLIGFNFVNDLPSSLLFEGIELTGLTLTFPKPTAGVIHTASCSMKLTSDWSFTPLLTLSDIELQCDMDFTGAQTVVDFSIEGMVTILGIDLPAYVKKKGETWTFGIADVDLHFSLNDLLSIIPLTSGVSFPDFINDITDVSIKIGRLEMVYNSDMSQLLKSLRDFFKAGFISIPVFSPHHHCCATFLFHVQLPLHHNNLHILPEFP